MSSKSSIKYELEGVDGSIAINSIKIVAKKAKIAVNYKNSESLCFKINNNENIKSCLSILRYIAEMAPASQLYGNTLFHEAVINQYLELFWNELELQLYTNTSDFNSSKILKFIDDLLLDNTYIVGNMVTLADIYLFSVIKFSKEHNIDLKSNYQNISRWFTTLENKL